MIYGIVEWRFDCDEASDIAKEVFNRVIGVDRFPVDLDADYGELSEQLHQVTKRSPVTIVRIREGEANFYWDNLWTELIIGGEQ